MSSEPSISPPSEELASSGNDSQRRSSICFGGSSNDVAAAWSCKSLSSHPAVNRERKLCVPTNESFSLSRFDGRNLFLGSHATQYIDQYFLTRDRSLLKSIETTYKTRTDKKHHKHSVLSPPQIAFDWLHTLTISIILDDFSPSKPALCKRENGHKSIPVTTSTAWKVGEEVVIDYVGVMMMKCKKCTRCKFCKRWTDGWEIQKKAIIIFNTTKSSTLFLPLELLNVLLSSVSFCYVLFWSVSFCFDYNGKHNAHLERSALIVCIRF